MVPPARDRVVALDRRDEVARDELRALRIGKDDKKLGRKWETGFYLVRGDTDFTFQLQPG